MINPLHTFVGLLVVLLLFAVLFWAARRIVTAFSLPAPIGAVLDVVIVIIFVLWSVRYLGFLPW